ncbi:hypothetical protein X797_007046 [Metarhizium robertsii]|uniref:Uncharacterized protein n=2 Tax=Metarhizium robertsii TaxID=568076 RepID=E9F614_METRA|nr:uncharacterized protein MAA_07713 [Metarhizium robertsii ARSEF 23]EFY96900.1 hypothetical protein MAA_07713 [Metarhizium robertsii ARSEF 23]EXU99917.1 hypothetical protein X797_007046 [Metarhizium robertsii]
MQTTNDGLSPVEKLQRSGVQAGQTVVSGARPEQFADMIDFLARQLAGEEHRGLTTTAYIYDDVTRRRYMLRVTPLAAPPPPGSNIGDISARDYMDIVITFDTLDTLSRQVSDVVFVEGLRERFLVEVVRVAYTQA